MAVGREHTDMPEHPGAPIDAVLVLTTASGQDQATAIATLLVEQKLAACVNIVPRVQSVYQWKGKLVKDEEALLFIKTRRPLFERVRTAIRERHSYDLPEVIAIDLDRGDPEALAWIRECTPDPGDR